jgi:hypothetical protein
MKRRPCFAAFTTISPILPPQLLGKSVVLSWSETRIERDEGEPNFRPVNANHGLTLYISTTGRVFSRVSNTTNAGSGGSEQVQGQSSASSHAPARVPSFSGQSMTYFQPVGQAGMRRVLIDFDRNFGNVQLRLPMRSKWGR